MSTFKFNFSGEEENLSQDVSNNKNNIDWLSSQEIIPSTQIINLDTIANRAKMFVCADVEIGHIDIKNNAAVQEESTGGLCNIIKLAEEEHSDLIAGKYEGGLKIWECTIDLIEYLEEHDKDIFQDKKVLDLGCGTGVLGIYALMNGSKVTFQDYNKEVIEHVTIPNVLLNLEEDEREQEIKKCKFYSGDWESFNKICDDAFDIILTSETIYNEQNYKKLIQVFGDRLKDTGVIYVAAKTYYFGVGGGTRQFEQSVKNNGSLESNVCWKSSQGIQREIIKLRKTS